MAYDVGDEVRLQAEFLSDNNPADPTVVVFQVRHRDEKNFTEFVYNPLEGPVKRTDIGKYYIDWTFTKSGQWWWRWLGTGSLNSAIENTTVVKYSGTVQV